MTDHWRLFAVRCAHTLIYLVMAAATVLVLFAGVTGATGRWLQISIGLVLIEATVFIGCGMRCPLTAVAVRYGARHDGPWDTFFPERCTRHTLTVFGPMMVVGVGLLLARWFIAGR
jgi:hypothetical protein